MIPLKIKKPKGKFEKINIPDYSELTIQQYSDIVHSIESDFDIVKYICITKGFDYVKAKDFQMKGLDAVNARLGEFRILRADQPPIENAKYIEDLKVKYFVRIDHGKENYEWFDLNNCKIETAGHRLLIEQEIKNQSSWMDLYIFSVAMLMTGTKYTDNAKKYDYELIKKYQALLMKENAYDILCLGGFFLRNIMHGEKGVKRFLRNWIFRRLTKTLILKNKPVLTA
jgi:hypothetical protein